MEHAYILNTGHRFPETTGIFNPSPLGSVLIDPSSWGRDSTKVRIIGGGDPGTAVDLTHTIYAGGDEIVYNNIEVDGWYSFALDLIINPFTQIGVAQTFSAGIPGFTFVTAH